MGRLILADGTVYHGRSVGAEGSAIAEVVFNTSMTGYQEILTDPSYAGQAVVLTSTMIGNTGVNPEDEESHRPWAAGLIVRECCRRPSNHRATESLPDYLGRHGIVALEGLDTRALTRRLRSQGVVLGALTTGDEPVETWLERVRAAPPMEGQDLVQVVSCARPYAWTEGFVSPFGHREARQAGAAGGPAWAGSAEGLHVAVLDFGVKRSILRYLVTWGFRVTVLPGRTDSAELRALAPDALVLSNGPGDPAALPDVVAQLQALLPELPMFGICLGHQLLGLALGARTRKLKFGHRGGNHPVGLLPRPGLAPRAAAAISAQNHGFVVDPDGLDPGAVEIIFENLIDGTVEGLRHRRLPVMSVQFHPEGAPGPHDAAWLFGAFVQRVRERAGSPVSVTAQGGTTAPIGSFAPSPAEAGRRSSPSGLRSEFAIPHTPAVALLSQGSAIGLREGPEHLPVS